VAPTDHRSSPRNRGYRTPSGLKGRPASSLSPHPVPLHSQSRAVCVPRPVPVPLRTICLLPPALPSSGSSGRIIRPLSSTAIVIVKALYSDPPPPPDLLVNLFLSSFRLDRQSGPEVHEWRTRDERVVQSSCGSTELRPEHIDRVLTGQPDPPTLIRG